MAMKKSRHRILQAAILACALFGPAAAHAAGQIDPFYTNLLEKAEKSFLARNYAEAARDCEIAAFGLSGNKLLLAKACVYLSLSKYFLKDVTASEKNLQQAAALMGEEGLSKLDVHESARPTLQKLLGYFGIPQPQDEALADGSAEPQPGSGANPGPGAPQKRDGETAAAAGDPASVVPDPAASLKPVLKFDELKEGDLVPLELVDTPPAAVKRVPAVYPNSAGAKMVEGTVIVNALVSEEGSVLKTEIGRSMKDFAGFDQAAVRAVLQWKFEPAVVNGIRVKVWLPVAIDFRKRT